ncbi:hypothetical protein V6N11_010696 [Hibiscus sabdariffa]|uniref:Uncharacterized protein n=1 Tax=Hibiscus sabdariffa TaxID=183260 RepID=A0ABR2S6V1_9ROSI
MGRVQIHQHINQFQWAPSSPGLAPRSGHAHRPVLLAVWVESSITGPIQLGVFMNRTRSVITGSNPFLLQLPSSSSMKKRETKALKTLVSVLKAAARRP